MTRPGFRRFLRVVGEEAAVDEAKVEADERYDGIWAWKSRQTPLSLPSNSNGAIMRSAPGPPRPLHFVGSSLKDLRGMPEDVQDVFGTALLDAQYGDQPDGARAFGEGLPSKVMKLAEDHDGDTYRAAYVASLPGAIYVLHAFKKKSIRGIGTPKPDKDLIRSRLQAAEAHHRDTYGEG